MTARRSLRCKTIDFTPEIRALFRLVPADFLAPATAIIRMGAARGTLTAIFRDPAGGSVTGRLRLAREGGDQAVAYGEDLKFRFVCRPEVTA